MYKSAARFRCTSSRISVGGSYAERSGGDSKVVNNITSKKNKQLSSVKHLKKYIGKKVPGMVINIKDYGAFIKLLTGETGLLHISKISKNRVVIYEVLKPGDRIEVILVSVEQNNNERRIQLSLLDSDLVQKISSKEKTK